MMFENELDLRTAGAVLAHSQVSQTARYSRVPADRKAVAAERIDQALCGHLRERLAQNTAASP
jgi:site-specific recombinase XerD